MNSVDLACVHANGDNSFPFGTSTLKSSAHDSNELAYTGQQSSQIA
jgi:hypothetical protein